MLSNDETYPVPTVRVSTSPRGKLPITSPTTSSDAARGTTLLSGLLALRLTVGQFGRWVLLSLATSKTPANNKENIAALDTTCNGIQNES